MFPLLCLGSCVNICQIQFQSMDLSTKLHETSLVFCPTLSDPNFVQLPQWKSSCKLQNTLQWFFSPAHIFEYYPYLQIKPPLFQQKLPSFNTSGVWCGALPIESLGISIRWLQIWWYYLDVIPLSWQHALQEMEVEPVTVSGRTHGPIAHSNYSTGWLVKTKPFEEKQQQYRICDEWLSYFVLSQAS